MNHGDILQLTAADIEEYAQSYAASHLRAGDWVWLDDGGELYLTADEIDLEIYAAENAISSGEWPDSSWERRLETLRSALRRLRSAAGV